MELTLTVVASTGGLPTVMLPVLPAESLTDLGSPRLYFAQGQLSGNRLPNLDDGRGRSPFVAVDTYGHW